MDSAKQNMMAYIMASNFDVLGVLTKHVIMSYLYGTSVITIERSEEMCFYIVRRPVKTYSLL